VESMLGIEVCDEGTYIVQVHVWRDAHKCHDVHD
jgi:hypothetical protein